jgi:hypothetical protein
MTVNILALNTESCCTEYRKQALYAECRYGECRYGECHIALNKWCCECTKSKFTTLPMVEIFQEPGNPYRKGRIGTLYQLVQINCFLYCFFYKTQGGQMYWAIPLSESFLRWTFTCSGESRQSVIYFCINVCGLDLCISHRHIDIIDSASSTYGSWKLVTTNF